MKIIKSIVFWVLATINIVILSIVCFALIAFIQSKLFLPNDYIMWVFKYPASRLVFIYEIYFLLLFLYIAYKKLVSFKIPFVDKMNNFIKKDKKSFTIVFTTANIILLYIIIVNVSVISNDKIKDYSVFSPSGREYSYEDVVSIDTGVYGNKIRLPFMHYKGEFYYIIEFNDGKKINLNDSIGGANGNEDVYKIFEDLDTSFVNMGVKKTASMENFEALSQRADKKYSDRIKGILENVK